MSTPIVRPWGTEDLFVENKNVTVKLLNVKQGEQLSLQYHHDREEFWKVVSGSPCLILGEETVYPKTGDEFTIPALTKHRISAPTDSVVILEISHGEFKEDDIVRLEDKYNRIEKNEKTSND